VSVAHELSSEIAAAILARKEETRKLKELKEVVLRVHNVLQELTAQCRKQNRFPTPRTTKMRLTQ